MFIYAPFFPGAEQFLTSLKLFKISYLDHSSAPKHRGSPIDKVRGGSFQPDSILNSCRIVGDGYSGHKLEFNSGKNLSTVSFSYIFSEFLSI